MRRKAISDELDRLEERAMWSAQGQFERSKVWRGVNLWIGAPSAVCAAIAGGLTLATDSLNLIGGILALAAAAGGGVLTAVNAAARADRASTAGNAYLEIQTAARQARLIDLPTLEIEDARQVLSELTARIDEQNKSAEPTSKGNYLRASRNIEAGGQDYDVDNRARTGGESG
ncbi:hypothetical protein GCM10010488_17010 [Oerskovia jenensis]